jgi:hypothetical protein
MLQGQAKQGQMQEQAQQGLMQGQAQQGKTQGQAAGADFLFQQGLAVCV